MTFGYDSTVAFSKSVAKVEDKALDLLNWLSLKRSADDNSSPKPIIFICHSLGGIIIKKALILAHERSSDPDYKDILDNTKAIAFLGVPYKGSDSAWWATFAANALKGASIGTFTNTALVADLKRDSITLTNISQQFVDRAKNLTLYTFFETQKLSGVLVLVDELSARIGLPNEKLFQVDANHRTICKIPSAKSQEYNAVGVWIAKLVKMAVKDTGTKEVQSPEEQPPLYYRNLVEQDRQLARLPCVVGAAFNSYHRQHEPQCICGTRVDLLRQVEEWSVNHEKCLFWLNGMAGTGKSTIARTVARTFHDQGRLGASYFFSRAQLADVSPLLKQYICEATAERPKIAQQGLRNQWKELILLPLSRLGTQCPTLRLVVDALDECEHEEDVKLILQLFVETKDLNAVNVGIFVTSRPEIPIRLGFRDMPEIVHQDLVLHDVPRPVIEHDHPDIKATNPAWRAHRLVNAKPEKPGSIEPDQDGASHQPTRLAKAHIPLSRKTPEPNNRPPLNHDPAQIITLLSLIPKTLAPHTTSALLTELAKPLPVASKSGNIYILRLMDATSMPPPSPQTAASLLQTPPRSHRAQDTDPPQHPANSNKTILLKIGHASNVHRRVNEWSRQCGYALSLVQYYPYLPSSSSSSPPTSAPSHPTLRKVPHAARIERLIHLELMERRVKKWCGVCGREHREWFEVEGSVRGLREVDEIVGRWVRWGEGLG